MPAGLKRFAKLLPLRPDQAESVDISAFLHEAHVNHAVGGGVRVRVHEDRVDHTEDGSGGTDAERHRDNGREREARQLDQLAESETQILKNGSHRTLLRRQAGQAFH